MRARTILLLAALIVAVLATAVVSNRLLAAPSGALDNNVQWDELYHAASGVAPSTELVPNQSYHFLEPTGSGADVYFLADENDLSAARIRYWDGSEHWVNMTKLGSTTAAFRGQPSRTYDIWQGVISGVAGGTTVYYRIEAQDGSDADYLKADNGDYTNPLGQHVRDANTDPDDYSFVVSSPTPSGARAIWLDRDTIAWNGTAATSYQLLYDPDGEIDIATAVATTCAFPAPAAPCSVDLTVSGTVSGFAKNPNTTGLPRLLTDLSIADARHLLKGQLVVAAFNGGTVADATGVQIQSVLDDLYATAAALQTLGVNYSGAVPTVKVWAPTAKSVTLRRYADATTTTFSSHTMTEDAASGVWSVTGDATWDRQFFLFDVEVYVPSTDAVEHNLVTDPYAVSLATDSARSQFVNLADADLKPAGWDALGKPALAAPEDIAIYEVHVRDFSINDPTVPAAQRGTFKAFTATGSDGMTHLLALQAAGLTHVHLLPAFDIASVPETAVARTPTPNPTGFGRSAQDQQAAVAATRAGDGFNWGYDPYHYGVPEGSYSTDPNGVTRIVEFREMVQTLNENGLRVVMDVVYNHTAASGQEDKSVLDKIVPGYYYRTTLDGTPETSSCCSDTASEYAMMEKLLVDTLVRWATEYKVDGFRFDLMNLHTVANAVNARNAVQAVDPDIYVYGEGWDFGSAAAKGLDYAKQTSMAGTGIGTFNDRLRDAAHGGYDTDATQIRRQGFINGLSYDWNGYCYNNRDLADLQAKMDILRSALRASGTDWNGAGSPYTADPQESVPYVSKHDNETLFDQNVFKLPSGDGSGLPGWCGSGISFTGIADRVRVQNLGLSLVGLSQGVPFFHMGSDTLRSKSLDRNSYDSGDWFNKVDWSYADGSFDNNFGKGLPPAWDNNDRWTIMTPLLNNTAVDPAAADAQANAAHLREILRMRMSSPLFRLQTEADVNGRVTFYNGDNTETALIVMGLSDAPSPDLDANYETILVFFNADKAAKTFTLAGANGFALHPVQADATDADPVVQTAVFNDSTDTFTIPPRTTAVFVSAQPIEPPSSVDWVGLMFPRGGVANPIAEGSFTPAGFDVFVQVYEEGVTPGAGQGAGLQCFLHWGEYGTVWSDVPMTYNADKDNNDEYKATIPQATLNALSPGTYGFTAYCQKTGESGKQWKADSYDINANPADDDQGDGLLTVIPAGDPRPAPAGGTFVHLFEWRWSDIEKECSFLAAKGYSAVQVSPPNEHLVPTADQGGQTASDFPWWVRYQPVTHDTALLTSRSGTLAEFQSMVNTCSALGVDIYVDAVINHTADVEVGNPPAGTAGTEYESSTPGRFYGTQYQSDDFHGDCVISSYADRAQVQSCQLSGLPDLDTGKADVQAELRAYLQSLIDMGVAGFRLDGSKHMPATDIAAILDGLTGDFYVFQEVIDLDPGERVRDWEYVPNGDVTEFAWSQAMADKFNQCNGNIADLATLPYANMLESRFAVTFVDNHDNQRGHGPGGGCIVDHRDGAVYDLATIFTLAYPYGYPKVMSSYYWSNNPADNSGDSLGPPSTTAPFGAGSGPETRPVYTAGQVSGDVPGNCAGTYEDGKWVCEHRRTAVANMVQFRKVTDGEAVSNWQTFDSGDIAFGRGSKGFVAINRTATAVTHTYQTGLAEGDYCDITRYDFSGGQCLLVGTSTPAPAGAAIHVDGAGQISGHTLPALSAFAIHSGAKIVPCSATAAPAGFNLEISLTGASNADVLLGWFDYGPAYDVQYSTADPYFDPASEGTQLLPVPSTNSATHTAVGNSLISYFYVVGVDNCAGAATSERVGKFTFAVTAGN